MCLERSLFTDILRKYSILSLNGVVSLGVEDKHVTIKTISSVCVIVVVVVIVVLAVVVVEVEVELELRLVRAWVRRRARVYAHTNATRAVRR